MTATLVATNLSQVSTTIQHMALVGVFTALVARPALPPGLHSLSLFAIPTPTSSADDLYAALVTAACSTNVRLNLKRCQTMDEVFDFDLEEWALSVEK